MIEIFLIGTTFLILYLSIRHAGYLPFPTGLIALLALSQVVFALVHSGLLYYQMLSAFNYGGLAQNYRFTQAIYTLMALLALMSLTGQFKDVKDIRLDREMLVDQATSETTFRYVSLGIMVVAAHLILFALVVDWSKLWFHRQYLQPLFDSEAVVHLGHGLTETVMRATPFFAILSIVCVCLLIGTRSVFFRTIAILMAASYYLILLAINSRSAVFVPALLVIYFSVLRLERRRTVALVFGTLCVLSLTIVLGARTSLAHGLSMVPSYFLSPFQDETFADSVQVILDFCQGIFVTAESFQIGGLFPFRYEVLAFSPLPSVIDGYSKLVHTSEHRLSLAVPMSGIGEAVNFGRIYVCVLIAELFLIIRVHARLARRAPVVFLLCNFLIMFSIYMMLAYPVRNGLRYGWLALLIAVLALARRAPVGGTEPVSIRPPSMELGMKPGIARLTGAGSRP